MGARPLKRVFENQIKKPLSKKILFDRLSGTEVIVTYQNDEYQFITELTMPCI
jgi:ATP-dependent Clp protease ATP-binding subunit ClpA